MHIQPMQDSDGVFSKHRPCTNICCSCGEKGSIEYRKWESSCGGYEDIQFHCKTCNHIWWVDGSDS